MSEQQNMPVIPNCQAMIIKGKNMGMVITVVTPVQVGQDYECEGRKFFGIARHKLCWHVKGVNIWVNLPNEDYFQTDRALIHQSYLMRIDGGEFTAAESEVYENHHQL